MALRKIIALILILSLMACAQAKSKYSKPYYIEVELTNQIVTIYNTENDSIVRQMICSTGLQDATPRGTYYLPRSEEGERTGWYYFSVYGGYAQYATRIIDNILFHSIPCSYKSQKSMSQKALSELGQPASHGCIRLRWQDAKYIADHCEQGTRVTIDKSHQENEDLRQLLLQESYEVESGLTYQQYMGTSNSPDIPGLGSTGSAVKDLQSRLRGLGIYAGAVTGEYHGDTVNAVKNAQRLMGLSPTGTADPDFMARLFADDAPVAYNVDLSDGTNGPAVRSLQRCLADLDIYTGPVDGVYDLEVSDALNRFQAAYGFRIDDVATAEVQKAIARESQRVHEIFDPMGGFSFDQQEETVDFARVEANSGIRLRSEPSTHGEVTAHAADNARVLVLEQGKEWSRVQHGGDMGYCKSEWLSFETLQNCVFTYATPDGRASYRIGHTRDEYLTGQVAQAELPVPDAEDALVSVNTGKDDVLLNLRQAPGPDGAVLGMLPNGSRVRLLLDAGEWLLVECGDVRGYLMAQYVERPGDEDEDAAVVQDNTVLKAVVRPRYGSKAQVFDADSDDAEVLGRINGTTRVDVIENRGNGWSRILVDGRQGYMRDEDLRFLTS